VPRLLIDVTRLLYRKWSGRLLTGIDRVGLEYVRHYRHGARAVVGVRGFSAVLPQSDSAALFTQLVDSAFRATPGAAWLITKACLSAWNGQDMAGSFFFHTAHSGLQHASFAAPLRRRGVRPIFVIHDLIPLSHPEYCRPGERDRHLRRMRHALSLAHGLVANSNDTLARLETFASEARLRMPPAVVAHLAPGLPAIAPGPRPLEAPYFVVLGTIEPRKNHLLLLRVWRRLIERLGTAAPHLVIVGQRGWECERVVDLLERAEWLRERVLEVATCSDAQLVTLLHHAQALLFPSFAEGFGLPLVEALSLGLPVIGSDLPVFREFAHEVPEYADPLDGERWLELITEYTDAASSRRTAQLERIRRYRPPDWKQHLCAVDALLEKLDRTG